MPETIKLTNKQKVEVTLRPVIREEGKEDTPVNLDGAPTWSIQSGNCTVEPSEDGLKAWVISGDEPGTSEILVEGDADLGEGVVTISDTLSVEVTNPLANNLGLSVGTPVDK